MKYNKSSDGMRFAKKTANRKIRHIEDVENGCAYRRISKKECGW